MVKKIRVLALSAAFPTSKYKNLGSFVKESVDAISKNKNIEVEVVSPKAWVLPYKWFPYHDFASIPIKEKNKDYTVHYPRYFYPIPSTHGFLKKLVYPLVGFFYKLSVIRYIKKNVKKPDVIHAHWSYPDGFAALKMQKYWNVPLCIHVRGTLEKVTVNENVFVRNKIIKALRNADAVFPNNEDLKQTCLKLGVKEEKIFVVNNGVDTSIFKPMDMMKCREKLGLPLHKKIILFVGNLQKIKDIPTIINAIRKISETEKYVKFIVVGSGEELENLKKLVDELRLDYYVDFVGVKPREQIPLWMNAADVIVLSSLSEGRPNILIEAMACKKPIVATSVGDIPNIVRHEKSGFLVNTGDYLAMANYLQKIFKDDKLADKMGVEGEKFIKINKLSWDNHAKELLRIYKSIKK